MTETAKQIAPPATLKLPGHDPTAARAGVLYRPRSLRLTRAALSLLGFWALIPIVFFIPPHLPWVLIAFALGIYFAYANWTGTYEVRHFEGACPRCGNALEIKPGSKISLPHKMTCYNCHHHPYLKMAEVPEQSSGSLA
jgi:hypothetical protein